MQVTGTHRDAAKGAELLLAAALIQRRCQGDIDSEVLEVNIYIPANFLDLTSHDRLASMLRHACFSGEAKKAKANKNQPKSTLQLYQSL
jgi:hypothetical protein